MFVKYNYHKPFIHVCDQQFGIVLCPPPTQRWSDDKPKHVGDINKLWLYAMFVYFWLIE